MPNMTAFLSRIYRKTGIHGAPPGTMLHAINAIVQRAVHPRRRAYASADVEVRGRFGAIPYYNIARLRKTRPVNGIALVFFMGAGDYLMATPMIEALHQAHPDLPIWAYVSSSADAVNSPLVAHFLRTNPLVDKVISYRGQPRQIWTDYDFSDAMKDIPSDFVTLPVIYDVDPVVFHRGTSLQETFGLRVQLPVATPIVYPSEMTRRARAICESIADRIAQPEVRGVVCTHFGARSSGYNYPHDARLVSRLLRDGFVVISFSPIGLRHANLVEVDVTQITPNDSVEILRSLKSGPVKLSMISVNSLMWPLSAALDIPNLGLHVFWDPTIHQYLYPNIYVVTQHLYGNLGPCRLFLAWPSAYEERRPPGGGTTFTDYDPEFVLDSFETMIDLT